MLDMLCELSTTDIRARGANPSLRLVSSRDGGYMDGTFVLHFCEVIRSNGIVCNTLRYSR